MCVYLSIYLAIFLILIYATVCSPQKDQATPSTQRARPRWWRFRWRGRPSWRARSKPPSSEEPTSPSNPRTRCSSTRSTCLQPTASASHSTALAMGEFFFDFFSLLVLSLFLKEKMVWVVVVYFFLRFYSLLWLPLRNYTYMRTCMLAVTRADSGHYVYFLCSVKVSITGQLLPKKCSDTLKRK